MSTAASPSKPFIRPTRISDILQLAQTMRSKDAAEVWHSARVDPHEALLRSFSASHCTRTVEWRGRVVAIFGVTSRPGGACPWMLASDGLLSIRKSFIRGCAAVVTEWLQQYGHLANSVWSENTVHIEWLKWLGFTFNGESVRNGQTFLHFHKDHHV